MELEKLLEVEKKNYSPFLEMLTPNAPPKLGLEDGHQELPLEKINEVGTKTKLEPLVLLDESLGEGWDL